MDKATNQPPKMARLQRLGLYATVVFVAFLIGFIPMWLRARTRADERDAVQQVLRLTQAENTLAAAAIQARRGAYEPARVHESASRARPRLVGVFGVAARRAAAASRATRPDDHAPLGLIRRLPSVWRIRTCRTGGRPDRCPPAVLATNPDWRGAIIGGGCSATRLGRGGRVPARTLARRRRSVHGVPFAPVDREAPTYHERSPWAVIASPLGIPPAAVPRRCRGTAASGARLNRCAGSRSSTRSDLDSGRSSKGTPTRIRSLK